MQGEKDEQPGGGKGKDPSPPQPPPRHEANGGHRFGPWRRRRPRRPRVRGEVVAVGFMVAATAYFTLADALAVLVEGGDDTPPVVWSFVAYMLWITGVNLFVLVSLMN
ncbi:hypothetical protein ABZP36_020555 [Zizania latifolia]